jgi:hypothetical protein
VHGFALGLSCNQITEETGLKGKRVLRALTCLRRAVPLAPPKVFAGTIEVDETYVGGQRRNQRKAQRGVPSKRGRGTAKQPVFGILRREGKVWAELVPNLQAETLLPLITNQVRARSTVCSDTWASYTGVAPNSVAGLSFDRSTAVLPA